MGLRGEIDSLLYWEVEGWIWKTLKWEASAEKSVYNSLHCREAVVTMCHIWPYRCDTLWPLLKHTCCTLETCCHRQDRACALSHKLAELFYMYVSKLYYEAALSRHFLLRAADSGKHLAAFERSSLGHQLMILLWSFDLVIIFSVDSFVAWPINLKSGRKKSDERWRS